PAALHGGGHAAPSLVQLGSATAGDGDGGDRRGVQPFREGAVALSRSADLLGDAVAPVLDQSVGSRADEAVSERADRGLEAGAADGVPSRHVFLRQEWGTYPRAGSKHGGSGDGRGVPRDSESEDRSGWKALEGDASTDGLAKGRGVGSTPPWRADRSGFA